MHTPIQRLFSPTAPNEKIQGDGPITIYDPSALRAVVLVFALLVFGVWVVFLAADVDRVVGVLAAVAVAAGGGFLGFLFGIPPALQESTTTEGGSKEEPRGGLEQVADWLTKILLGAGLTQLEGIKHHVKKLAEWISTCITAPGSGTPSLANVFGLSVVGYFSVVGFLVGYLATRLLLAELLRNADEGLLKRGLRLGKAKGLEEGKAKGREEGLQLGEMKGLETAAQELGAQNLLKQAVTSESLGTASAEKREQVIQAEKWKPALPITVADDPLKGRFEGNAEAGGRRLSAKVTPLRDKDSELFRIDLLVEASPDRTVPLVAPVKFFLHDTFKPDTYVVLPSEGRASLENIIAWGAFTVGAITDDGRTLLELDLADLPDAPAKFRER